MALAFDRSESFAIDKAAGEACRHLDAGGRCRIHADLKPSGFSGCAAYNCLGAGQRVTQAMFAGRSWQADPELLAPMMAAFARVRRAHEVLELLDAAGRLPLAAADARERDAHWTAVDVCAETGAFAEFEVAEANARAFIRSLARYVTDRR